MSCKKLKVKQSHISGTGLFTNEFIKKGDIVMLWNVDAFLTTEKDYLQKQRAGDPVMIVTGVRYIDNYFLYTDGNYRIENYINHSFEPNILYHCGICFAMNDIYKNEELTTDYTYLLSEHDVPFTDKITGKKVCGVSSISCLKETTRQLADIFKNL